MQYACIELDSILHNVMRNKCYSLIEQIKLTLTKNRWGYKSVF